MESFCTRYSPLVGDILKRFRLKTKILTFLTFCTKICRKLNCKDRSREYESMASSSLATVILFLNLTSERELIRVKG